MTPPCSCHTQFCPNHLVFRPGSPPGPPAWPTQTPQTSLLTPDCLPPGLQVARTSNGKQGALVGQIAYERQETGAGRNNDWEPGAQVSRTADEKPRAQVGQTAHGRRQAGVGQTVYERRGAGVTLWMEGPVKTDRGGSPAVSSPPPAPATLPQFLASAATGRSSCRSFVLPVGVWPHLPL